MSRLAGILGPVVALIVSFVSLFALTWVFAQPRAATGEPSGPARTPQHTPPADPPSPPTSPPPPASPPTLTSTASTPPPRTTPEEPLGPGLVLEVRGVQASADGSIVPQGPLADVVQVSANQICLSKAFVADGWTAVEGDAPWSNQLDGRSCRSVTADQTVDVKFVKHE